MAPTEGDLLARRSPIALAVLAVLAVVVGFAPGSEAAVRVALPDSPVGKQLAWVIREMNGGSAALAAADVKRHVTAQFLVGLPAGRLIALAKEATSAYAPVRFTGFAGHPSATSAIALIETRSHQELAIYASIDGRSRRGGRPRHAAPPPRGAGEKGAAR